MPEQAHAAQPPRRRRRLLWRIGRSILLTYLLVMLVFAIFQEKLIFPGASSQGLPESTVSPPPGAELLHLRAADGISIAALFGTALTPGGTREPRAPTRPTLLWFYGNAMCMNDALLEFKEFRELGANVMLVDYEGFGMSDGKPGEQGCYAAAEAAYQHLLTRPDIDPRKILVGGWSLGGAVAIEIASRHAGEGHVCGIMTFCTFTSMAELGRWHYPIFPIRLLLRHRFDSLQKLPRLDIPLLMGHGKRDNIVPFSMNDRLVSAAEAHGLEVVRVVNDEASHNDFFDIAQPQIDHEASAFLQRFF